MADAPKPEEKKAEPAVAPASDSPAPTPASAPAPSAAAPAAAPGSPAPTAGGAPGLGGKKIPIDKILKVGGKVGLALVFIILLYFTLAYFGLFAPAKSGFHEHADFKVYIQGKPYNFSMEKYMNKEVCGDPTKKKDAKLIDKVHMHDLNGNVVHVHAPNMTWGDFFFAINMRFNVSCFALDTKQQFCDDGQNTLKFYVNGQKNFQMENQVIHDLDRALISYGSETPAEILKQMGTVTDEACIYSDKCPARGRPQLEEGCGSA